MGAVPFGEALAKLGGAADAHVRMALRCEADGLYVQRLVHLVIAVLTDPAHATARGLLGLVAYDGRWQSPAAVADQLGADETGSAMLGEYHRRRARMSNTADAHWKMAVWCEQKGLKPEAAAHLMVVTQVDPGREAAWKRLGYRRQGGRWATAEQLAADKAEAEIQKKASKRWMAVLAKLRSDLENLSKKAGAIEGLAAISDPRAVPSIWATFADGTAAHQEVAAGLLGQIDSAGSTRALALLALWGKSPEVRSKATAALGGRSVRDIASFLVALLRDPELDPDPILYHYRMQPAGSDGIGSEGYLFVQGPMYNVLRTYPLGEGRMLRGPSGFIPAPPRPGYESRIMTARQRQSTDLAAIINGILSESEGTVLDARLHVRQVEELNAQIIRVLTATTGEKLGTDRQVWRKWWAEEQGYSYDPPPSAPRQDLTLSDIKPTFVADVRVDCFAAGTPVQTLTGPRAIELVKVGDQVLTQDLRRGSLGYHPVVATAHSQPDELLRINLGHETIKATEIDRFWKVGQGWVMARDLKPGDRVRSVGGTNEVTTVEQSSSEPVYNLKVMDAECFFVGRRGVLVHDNSLVEPVLEPFDAVPDLATIIELSDNNPRTISH